MRIAILSDVHGNLEALEAVLADLDRRPPDRVYCLGDFIGYGASPNECLARLRPLIAGAVLGNHDAAAIGRTPIEFFNADAARAAVWSGGRLTADHATYLTALPYAIELDGARLVHATPAEPAEWHYVVSPSDATAEFAAFGEPLCLIGHTHVPGVWSLDGAEVRYSRKPAVVMDRQRRYLVNAGSVGQPRDGDPRAAYLLWEVEERRLSHVRVDYDVEGARRRILAAGLPPFLGDRLLWGE